MTRKRGRPPSVTQQQIARMRLLRSIGWSVEKIMADTGLSNFTVTKYTKDLVEGFLDPKNHGKPDIFR